MIFVSWFMDSLHFQYLAVPKQLLGWEELELIINLKGLSKYACNIYLWKEKLFAFLQHQVLGTNTDLRDLYHCGPLHHRHKIFLWFVLGRNTKSMAIVYYCYQTRSTSLL